jgi:hypothetical protein
MVLTDRQAADSYASRLVGAVHQKMAQRIAGSAGHNIGATLWRGLNELTSELYKGLIGIYAGLPGASASVPRAELIAEIQQRVCAFIQSCVVTHSGTTGAGAARRGAILIGRYNSGTPADFDLGGIRVPGGSLTRPGQGRCDRPIRI